MSRIKEVVFLDSKELEKHFKHLAQRCWEVDRKYGHGNLKSYGGCSVYNNYPAGVVEIADILSIKSSLDDYNNALSYAKILSEVCPLKIQK